MEGFIPEAITLATTQYGDFLFPKLIDAYYSTQMEQSSLLAKPHGI